MDALIQLEKDFLPLSLCNGWVEPHYLIETFGDFSTILLKKLGSEKFSKNDFTLKKYSYKTNKGMFYVVIFYFPFEENHEYVKFANRAFMVISPDGLEKIHYFLSELEEYIKENGSLGYKYKIREYCAVNEGIMVKEEIWGNPPGDMDDLMAEQAVYWSVMSEERDKELEKGNGVA